LGGLPENVSASFYTRSDKMIVSDGRNLVCLPVNGTDLKTKFAELNIKHLDANGPESFEDIKIIRRLVERANIGVSQYLNFKYLFSPFFQMPFNSIPKKYRYQKILRLLQ
jgi:hypothetical protein